MYNEPIFLKPVFKERIWGGTQLRELFNYDIPSDQTGECWGISSHANGPNEIVNGPLAGKTLTEAWKENRELFGDQAGEDFPLLVKILDAKKDLSVQVHPDDTYAKEKENEAYGKTECWYVIDCEEGAEIVFGHHAKTREELQMLVENGEWGKLLRRVKVHPGDFFYVPSGTIHAIGAGVQILETQQSSDITYRVYDYDRVGADGNKRELHLNESLEVTTVPHEDPQLDRESSKDKGLKEESLVKADYFGVVLWELDGRSPEFRFEKYILVSVIEGKGMVKVGNQRHAIKKGSHFILPTTMEPFELEGKAKMVVSWSNK
ncbi:mannose-6-phosphate isomerase, class I [Thalassobacillus devorans]|uniref:Mannose-6-phosphate isomerase n=1 Tax=Thalassobacillus devorans TaxID=279813 RepID=A0ABQ1NQS7_9BACI|nr:mannose-6-phosphate isomerase, class I [Thalassobacillus devorans]NIK28846.1 mannose-6-phosphate isomerase [Thalassobacillus devorans]GGC83106.1 mannose-6-phosphate isomerase, class I [Thalassobacillus devorans]